jgi:hypothetical protein
MASIPERNRVGPCGDRARSSSGKGESARRECCSRRPVGGASCVRLLVTEMLRTAKRLQSRAVNHHNFLGIPPLVWIIDKSSTNGVLSNVIPFVSVAFIVAENMIKKAALPDRRGPYQRNMFRESLFQDSDPWPKLKIVGSADEKMNMIGHHHISADGDFVNPVRLLGKPNECRVHRIGREQFPPLVCTKCDEEQGIVSEDPPQSRRQFWIFAHRSLVAASLWEAQCRYTLAARNVAHRATATEAGMRFKELEPPSKETRARHFRGV